MGLNEKAKKEIYALLINTVLEKLKDYKPETTYMPFHHRLLGKDRYALFSFIQSMNTTFGMSIWEQVAVILARTVNYIAERQYELLGEINEEAEKIISKIHFELRQGKVNPNIERQISQIRKKIKPGPAMKDPDSIVDLYIKINTTDNYFDITTAKPNMKDFVALKLKLLRWAGLRLSQDKDSSPVPRLAIPYNPYHPQPYERWTLKGLYDLKNGEILVGEEFWNLVGGGDIYNDLLNIFQKAGEDLREEINKRFAEFSKDK